MLRRGGGGEEQTRDVDQSSSPFAVRWPACGRVNLRGTRNSTTNWSAGVAAAIDEALQKIEAQRAGLKGRLDDVIARSAIVGGNDIGDFLTRDEVRSTLLVGSDGEITRGQARLKTLDEQLSHFKFLKAALRSGFPDFGAR